MRSEIAIWCEILVIGEYAPSALLSITAASQQLHWNESFRELSESIFSLALFPPRLPLPPSPSPSFFFCKQPIATQCCQRPFNAAPKWRPSRLTSRVCGLSHTRGETWRCIYSLSLLKMPTECDELSTTGYQRIRSEDQDLKARSHFKRSCERPRIHHYETPLTAVQASQEILISSTRTALLARVRKGED